jgi:hypothetical protein
MAAVKLVPQIRLGEAVKVALEPTVQVEPFQLKENP